MLLLSIYACVYRLYEREESVVYTRFHRRNSELKPIGRAICMKREKKQKRERKKKKDE